MLRRSSLLLDENMFASMPCSVIKTVAADNITWLCLKYENGFYEWKRQEDVVVS